MTYLRYSDDMEVIEHDEAETIARVRAMMVALSQRVADKHGRAMKGTHAKASGLVTGHLDILPGLPAELAQGVFATPRRYEALVRYSSGPPEKLSDKASGQRGMAIKLLGVPGERIAQSDETTTQDFVLAVDPAFNAATAAQFLHVFRPTAAQSPRVAEAGIELGSRIARGIEAVIEAVGGESANLKFIGRPPRHPVGDPYYSQAPLRYGDFVAKIAAVPSGETLARIGERRVDTADDDIFRHATEAYFARYEAVYDIKVQLCTDLATMPIEDASVVWSEDASPYRPVARLVLPPQAAFSPARETYFDDRLAFNPAHAVIAHRPLGSINRARMEAYKQTAALRRRTNDAAPAEPASFAEVPD